MGLINERVEKNSVEEKTYFPHREYEKIMSSIYDSRTPAILNFLKFLDVLDPKPKNSFKKAYGFAGFHPIIRKQEFLQGYIMLDIR